MPPTLDDVRLTDVATEYFVGATVEFNIRKTKENGNLLYLGVFNNKTWIPITCVKIIRDKAVFRNLESGIAYQALYLLHNRTRGREERIFTYTNGKQVWW